MAMQHWFLCWALIGVFLFCFILVYEAFQLKFRADKEGNSVSMRSMTIGSGVGSMIGVL